MLKAATILVCLSVTAACCVISIAVYRWNLRQEHLYKIGLMNSNNHSWEEFDMVNKDRFESEYWMVAENGKNSATA